MRGAVSERFQKPVHPGRGIPLTKKGRAQEGMRHPGAELQAKKARNLELNGCRNTGQSRRLRGGSGSEALTGHAVSLGAD